MSEQLVEHPIPLIDNLLKSRIGDEGRLLYLRKAITGGKIIHDSDKKFLKKMQKKIQQTTAKENFSKTTVSSNLKNNSYKNKVQNLPSSIHDVTSEGDNFQSEISKIQNSLSEVKTENSKISDNLELLFLNRNILETKPVETTTFSKLTKNNTSEMFDLIKENTPLKKFSFFGIKKYHAMAFLSAGLFSIWYAGYQNLIDAGPVHGITLGFSAGAAASAGLFYKNRKKQIFANKKL